MLPCISYPAFALDDEALFSQTLDKVVRKLKGKYGFKRFLRDGYRTALEDPDRRYYKPAEIKVPETSARAASGSRVPPGPGAWPALCSPVPGGSQSPGCRSPRRPVW